MPYSQGLSDTDRKAITDGKADLCASCEKVSHVDQREIMNRCNHCGSKFKSR